MNGIRWRLFVVLATVVMASTTHLSLAWSAPASTSVRISYSSHPPIRAGDAVIFHVSIRSDEPPSSSPSTNGKITLSSDGETIGEKELPPQSASAEIRAPGFPRGERVVTAKYSGTADWAPSEASVTFTVEPRYTEPDLAVNGCSNTWDGPYPSGPDQCHAVEGEEVTLEFFFNRWWEWEEGDPRPSGDVVFTASAGDGAVGGAFGPDTIARATIDGYHAVATTRDLPVREDRGTIGCYYVRGEYSGDAYYEPEVAWQSVCVKPKDRPDAPVDAGSGGDESDPGQTESANATGEARGTDADATPPRDDAQPRGTSGSKRNLRLSGEASIDAADETSPARRADGSSFAAPARRSSPSSQNGSVSVIAAALAAAASAGVVAASTVGPWAPTRRRLGQGLRRSYRSFAERLRRS